jgi:hypothetical protein
MGIVKGLKKISQHLDAEEAKFARRTDDNGEERVKIKWFGLKDGEAVKVIFLQEMDEESENYSEKNGLGFLAVEHAPNDLFPRKAVCTIEDEGACLGCEKHREDYKAGWKQKTKLYINVLVDDGVNEPYPAVLSQGNGPKSVTPSVIEQATEIGTITDKWFKIKRKGSGQTDTSYLLTPLGAHDKNVEDYEVFDLDQAVRNVPYAQQAAHFFGGTGGGAAAEDKPVLATNKPSAKADDDEW